MLVLATGLTVVGACVGIVAAISRSNEPQPMGVAFGEPVTGAKAVQPNIFIVPFDNAAKTTTGNAGKSGGAKAPASGVNPAGKAIQPGTTGKPGGANNGATTGVPHDPPGVPPTGNRPPPTTPVDPKPTTPTEQPPTSTSTPGGILCPLLCGILGKDTGFFATAPQNAKAAYEMLDPALRDGGVDQFQAAWNGVRSATVDDIVDDGPLAAKVIITYTWDTGRKVRTEQRIAINGKENTHITEASVTSATSSS